MNWLLLVAAGLVEVAWSQSIKPTAGFTRPLPTLLCFALAAVAVYLLSLAMQDLPVGTAYAVFTGIGAAGAITLGVVLHEDPVTPGRLLALALIIGGVALSHATTQPG
ncbi:MULTISPECIES: DMT family transporter [Streptomyces]|uniref:Multidrug efflux SMR transporter n=1 Tax=Streptomyces katrae TaxID=68223 RepID=A0ABT7H2N8_9ACTN|nr:MULTISPECIES: multidrug efflux SMR transporter [Streptomyces]MDK9500165.1 multidrug efflux SMR transporter [Streptomyces katrae]RST08884.1 multidrug efflux SMR transporter [Streptomyces sp. WAC07149]GLX19639.1 QacE family quaternary ammonium compound efflux SMR transporter [Streptomyces lavendulae subsp. lavendulae]GLX27134.1 QacE family quaternary ammonium compound efflux SMR transporter [Streptomyces lavendulae subsp. lavendulae]